MVAETAALALSGEPLSGQPAPPEGEPRGRRFRYARLQFSEMLHKTNKHHILCAYLPGAARQNAATPVQVPRSLIYNYESIDTNILRNAQFFLNFSDSFVKNA